MKTQTSNFSVKINLQNLSDGDNWEHVNRDEDERDKY